MSARVAGGVELVRDRSETTSAKNSYLSFIPATFLTPNLINMLLLSAPPIQT